MPVRRGTAAPRGGVYAVVRRSIEEDARRHAERVGGWPASVHPYQLQRVLDALRAGEPTDVPAWAVPPAAHSRDTATCYAAIVRPNDTVTFDVDDGALLWLEYQGL
jgi:hypothetical protein